MFQISDVAVVIITIPKMTAAAECLIRFVSRERFPGMYNIGQWIPQQLFGKDMNMIGHDYPGQKTITSTIEMKECVFNNPGNTWISQVTGAQTIVQ